MNKRAFTRDFARHSELVSESPDCGIKSADMATLKPVQGDGKTRKKAAFTLAETLITLTIIGVIASLTIPNLYSKYFERMAVTRAKQTYSQLTNAYKMVENKNRCRNSHECLQDCSKGDTACQFGLLAKHLKVVQQHCGNLSKIDWIPDTSTNLDGTKAEGMMVIGLAKNLGGSQSAVCVYKLKNGVTIASAAENTFGSAGERRLYITFDINGKTPPNQTGKDIFIAGIMNKGMVPELVKHPWAAYSTGGVSRCYAVADNKPDINCYDGYELNKRPLLHVLLKDKLPDLSKAE